MEHSCSNNFMYSHCNSTNIEIDHLLMITLHSFLTHTHFIFWRRKTTLHNFNSCILKHQFQIQSESFISFTFEQHQIYFFFFKKGVANYEFEYDLNEGKRLFCYDHLVMAYFVNVCVCYSAIYSAQIT